MDDLRDIWSSVERKEDTEMIAQKAFRAARSMQQMDRIRDALLIALLVLALSPLLFKVNYRETPSVGFFFSMLALTANLVAYRRFYRDDTQYGSLSVTIVEHSAKSLERLDERQRFHARTAGLSVLLLVLAAIAYALAHKYLRAGSCGIAAGIAWYLGGLARRSMQKQADLLWKAFF